MARKSYSQSKNYKIYYVIEDYYRNGKRTTKKLETIGKEPDIIELAKKENIDVNTWLNNYINNYNKTHTKVYDEVIIKKYSNKSIPKNVTNKFNIGYLFLKDIYYSLKTF